MLVYTRHVEPMGFKSSSMFCDSKCSSHYYKRLPAACAVMLVSNDAGDQLVQVFRLSPDDYRKFVKGRVSLVPTGCCNASGGKSVYHPDILFRGQFKTARHIKEVVGALEKIVSEEGRLACKLDTSA